MSRLASSVAFVCGAGVGLTVGKVLAHLQQFAQNERSTLSALLGVERGGREDRARADRERVRGVDVAHSCGEHLDNIAKEIGGLTLGLSKGGATLSRNADALTRLETQLLGGIEQPGERVHQRGGFYRVEHDPSSTSVTGIAEGTAPAIAAAVAGPCSQDGQR